MFGIGEGELLIIVLFAFMIFGPDKLPGMGRTLGRALRQFRNAQEGFTEVVQTNIVDPAAEAMSDNPKRPNRKRHEEQFEEDADLELADGEEAPRPKRTETFAERKKRLAEEKAAREAAEKAAAAAAAVAPDDEDADKDDASPAADQDAPAGEAADEPATEAPAPAKPSVSDLYTMRRPSRPAALVTDDSDAGVSPSASPEASEERSDERRAVEGDLGADGAAAATTDEKEA